MRVGLNATCFNDRPSGARQRFVGIYGALIRRCPDIDFVIYEPSDCAVASWFGGTPNIIAVRTPLPSGSRTRRTLAGARYWRGQVRRDRLDLFETFNLPMPGRLTCPAILTVHDIRSTRCDQPWPQRTLARFVHRRAIRRAAAVITVSDSMRREILELEPGGDVRTIYNGIDPSLFDAQPGPKADVSASLPTQFLLAVGHIEPRKNYGRLIEVLARLRQSRPDLALVIVGRDGGGLADLGATIEAAGLASSVQLRHDVPDEQLRAIYRRALLVVFPSLYEGFGIPVLEAMAASRPLVVSDLPVFRELIGERGAYFSPRDVTAMTETIAAVLGSPARHSELIEDGRVRVRDFAFDRLAQQVEAVYRDVSTQRRASVNRGTN